VKPLDAVIIGSGPGGLGVGALLAKAGKRVVVLERQGYIGGRATSYTWNGYTFNTGPHGGFVDGELDRLLRKVGKEPPARGIFDDAVTYKDKKIIPMLNLIRLDDPDLPRLLQAVTGVTPEQLATYDSVSAKEWLDSLEIKDDNLRTLVRLGILVGTTIPRLEEIAASAAIESMRPLASPPQICWASHGYLSYMQLLADTITEHGGEVRVNAEVVKVLVESNQVKGVLLEEGEKEISGEVRAPHILESPVVVAAFPIWDLFECISPNLFPEWFVQRVTHLKRTTAFFGLYAGLKEPLYREKHWILLDSPRTGYPLAAYMETNVCPELAPPGRHLFNCCYLCDLELTSLENRERLYNLLDLARQDLEEIFPGWEGKCLWIKPFIHSFEEPARTPGRAGVFRPGPTSPAVEGLYFAGDTVTSRALPGLECAADSAMRCAEVILSRRWS